MEEHAEGRAAGPESAAVAGRASRARRRMLWSVVPFLVLGVARAVVSVHNQGVLVAAVCFVAAFGFLAVVLGALSAAYHRGMRKLIAAMGPGSWASVCTDVRRPELWRAVVADSGGVRLLGDRRGTLVASWSWGDIHAIAVEKTTVGERNGYAVVLHMRDGSTTPLAFLVFWALGFPRRRAQVVAGELERRRQAHAGTVPETAPPLLAVPVTPSTGADRPIPTPLAGPSAGRLQVRGYLLAYGTVLALLPSIAFESYLPGGARTELLTFIPVGSLCFVLGYAVVFRGFRKGRREVDRGYTTIVLTAGSDQTLFLLDWRDLRVLSRPFQPRPDKLPRRKRGPST